MGKNSETDTGDAKSHLLDSLTRSRDSVTEFSRIEFNISYLETINRIFVPFANTLIETGSYEERQSANYTLRMWVADDIRVPAARNSANAANIELGTKHDEVTYILDEVIREKSHERIVPSFPDGLNALTASPYYFGDKIILKDRAYIRPNLLEASNEEIDRYYHPLMIVTAIFDPRNDEERFLREAPDFIAWASAAEDMHAALSGALQTGSLNPDTIQAIISMRGETSVPLHEGLL